MLPKSLKQWREHQLAPRESERCPASPGVLEPRIAKIFQGVTMMQLRNYMEQARVETRGSIKRRPFGFTCRMCLDKQKIHQNPKHRSYSCLRQFAYRWKLLVAMFVIALKSTYYTEWHRWWPLEVSHIFVIRSGSIFSMAWKFVKGWISPRTASKINVPRLTKVRGWIGDGDDDVV